MLEDMQPSVRIAPCKVREIMAQLDEKDQKILESALRDHDTWPTKTLSRELSARGLRISDTPITKHRNGGCSC